jgi:hypothetical protein
MLLRNYYGTGVHPSHRHAAEQVEAEAKGNLKRTRRYSRVRKDKGSLQQDIAVEFEKKHTGMGMNATQVSASICPNSLFAPAVCYDFETSHFQDSRMTFPPEYNA